MLIGTANNERIEPAHFRLEQSGRRRQKIGTERIAANEFTEIAAGVRFGHALRAHLEQFHGDTAPGELPSRFRAGQPAADNANDIFHEDFGG